MLIFSLAPWQEHGTSRALRFAHQRLAPCQGQTTLGAGLRGRWRGRGEDTGGVQQEKVTMKAEKVKDERNGARSRKRLRRGGKGCRTESGETPATERGKRA